VDVRLSCKQATPHDQVSYERFWDIQSVVGFEIDI